MQSFKGSLVSKESVSKPQQEGRGRFNMGKKAESSSRRTHYSSLFDFDKDDAESYAIKNFQDKKSIFKA